MISCISKLFQLVSKICWYLATFVLPSLVLTYFPAAGRLLQSFLHAFSLDKKSASHVDYAIPAKKKSCKKIRTILVLLQKLFKSKTVRNFQQSKFNHPNSIFTEYAPKRVRSRQVETTSTRLAINCMKFIFLLPSKNDNMVGIMRRNRTSLQSESKLEIQSL